MRPASATLSRARSIFSTAGAMRSKKATPASVRERRRVVRWNSRLPSSSSSPLIARDTIDGSTWRSRATAAKLPRFTTSTKICSAVVSMTGIRDQGSGISNQ